MGHAPTRPGGDETESGASVSLGRAAEEIRKEMSDNNISVDVDVDASASEIGVQVKSGLPPIARGVLARVASRHELDVEWAGEAATLTPE